MSAVFSVFKRFAGVLVLSLLGWLVKIASAALTPHDSEGDAILADLAGLASLALTGPLAIHVIRDIVRPPVAFRTFLGYFLLLSAPTLFFQGYSVGLLALLFAPHLRFWIWFGQLPIWGFHAIGLAVAMIPYVVLAAVGYRLLMGSTFDREPGKTIDFRP